MAMGRPRVIESPEILKDLFENYVRLTKLNPIIVVDFVGGKGSRAEREKERPLTMEGFEIFCFKEEYTADLSRYFANKDDKYSDFCAICLYIRKVIRDDQISGGMAGIYNPSITQRLNGLVEKTQTDLNANVNILNIDPLE